MSEASERIAGCFGSNLRRCRRRAGLSQEAVAIRASLHRTEVGLLERGERIPRIDTAIKLASAVEAEFGDLIAGICWHPGESHTGSFEPRAEVQSGGTNSAGFTPRPRASLSTFLYVRLRSPRSICPT